MNNLTILWLDDQRDPYRYLNTKSNSNTYIRNKQFYNKLMTQYNVKFIWVKNLYQFINYINKNGVPEFISFDHDLNNREGGKGLSDEQKINNNGVNAAKWLVNYCKQNKQPLPKFYVHSANPKHGPEINKVLNVENKIARKIILKESQLGLFAINEDVFASKKTGKNKLQLTYNKRQSSDRTRNMGQLNPFDTVNTGKMDQDNEDTYIVPLKGGIESYNITSIKGTEVMHYFKNKFGKMNLDLDGDGVKEEYELWMSDPEYKEFFTQFCKKVDLVINYAIKKMGAIEDFKGISIYPVPSSSNFNTTMVKMLAGKVKFANLPVIAIDSAMFKKSQDTIKADEDFMNKNGSYFNDKMFAKGNNSISHRDYVYNTVSKINQTGKIKKLIEKYNISYDRLYRCFKNNRRQYGERFPEALAKFYGETAEILKEIENELYYSGGRMNIPYEKLKGTKSPSEIKNTQEVWQIVKPFFRGTGQKPIVMHRLQIDDFQIKNLSNDTRMGMMDYFSTNDEFTQQELEKTRGTVFVIFDDNISGGATLSDICYQAKKLGIKYLIPITFGQMAAKYTLGQGNVVNKPKDGKFVN